MRFRRTILIVFIFAAIIALYVVHYLQIIPSQDVNESPNSRVPRPLFHIAVVACGQRMQETLVMIKSALLFNQGSTKDRLRFLVFTEESLFAGFREKLDDWRTGMLNQFDFELLPLQFPNDSAAEWRSLFKPCAAQRLFLPSLLNSIDSLLYVDTDTLFLSPVSDIWGFFGRFNATQIAALTSEDEDENIGWYNRFARHPYYGRLGVNSGVMLMNLTRMRQFKWEAHVFPIHKEYKLRITWGDQDIINILFYYHPETLYVMPCEYNYRPDHCMYMSVCNASTEGIKVIHGNRGYFHSNKQPLFRIIYEAVESYQLGTHTFRNFLAPLQIALENPSVAETNCGKMSKESLHLAKRIFLNDYNYEAK